MNLNKDLGLRERTCKICRKTFECRKEYAYKVDVKKGKRYFTYYFCSYKHLREWEKEKEKKPTPLQKRIIEELERGGSYTEVARKTRMSKTSVEHLYDKWANVTSA